MMLSAATDMSQTIRRKVEQTSATALRWPTKRNLASDSAMTDFYEYLIDPIIECSTVRPGSRIAIGSYSGPESVEEDIVGYWRAIGRRIRELAGVRNVTGIGEVPNSRTIYDLADMPSSGNPHVVYAAGSMLRESTDLICTNGHGCTLVGNKSFLNGIWTSRSDRLGAVLTFFESGVGSCQTVYIIGAENLASDPARQAKRRQHLKMAHQMAMAGLRAAEEARARAVEDEAKLGIDWDDWEDDSH